MDLIKIGPLTVSRFILGSNPFSGFSHQGSSRDAEMVHYFTTQRIKQVLRDAESLGITAVIARADHHVIRTLMEYWDEGGKLQWLAQTCPGVGPTLKTVQMAIQGGPRRSTSTAGSWTIAWQRATCPIRWRGLPGFARQGCRSGSPGTIRRSSAGPSVRSWTSTTTCAATTTPHIAIRVPRNPRTSRSGSWRRIAARSQRLSRGFPVR